MCLVCGVKAEEWARSGSSQGADCIGLFGPGGKTKPSLTLSKVGVIGSVLK